MYFTATKEDDSIVNRIVQYELAEDATTATLDRVIVDDIPAGGHHQGGRMRIGPDGLLYVGVGAFDPALGQDPDSLAGKLLRMNLDGSIPADNPNAGLIFVSGIRNTQGYDWFDDDHLLIMDHGPTGLELGMSDLRGLDEFNVARAGDNLGWASIWGCAQGDGLVDPVMVWETAMPPGGATLYTGTAIPAWTGSFMVGSLGFASSDGQHLHRIQVNPDNPYLVERHEVYLRGTYGRLRTVAMGADGHLYLTTSNCDGRGTCPPEGDLVLRVVGTL
jgi:glucose/arabinose dehydrogenase